MTAGGGADGDRLATEVVGDPDVPADGGGSGAGDDEAGADSPEPGEVSVGSEGDGPGGGDPAGLEDAVPGGPVVVSVGVVGTLGAVAGGLDADAGREAVGAPVPVAVREVAEPPLWSDTDRPGTWEAAGLPLVPGTPDVVVREVPGPDVPGILTTRPEPPAEVGSLPAVPNGSAPVPPPASGAGRPDGDVPMPPMPAAVTTASAVAAPTVPATAKAFRRQRRNRRCLPR